MSLSTLDDLEEDLPDIFPGEIVHNHNGDISFKIINQIGGGRCCVVYKAVAVRDGSVVALKCFRQGSNYDGAIQRERFILDTFSQPGTNIVTSHATINYRGYTLFVLELLQDNVRQIIFKNERQGLSPWLTVKFAQDLLTALSVLHRAGIVHADLKPANVLWSGQDGVFKTIDFGLSFNVEERDLHQIQSTGYRAPEAARWNEFKENIKIMRKRKLEGTFTQLNRAEARGRDLLQVTEDANSLEIICDIDATKTTKTKPDITKSNKRKYYEDTQLQPQLQHSDSHSSGIFSLENSEREGEAEATKLAAEDSGLEVEVVLGCGQQDWRLSRHCGQPSPPSQPGPPADLWSYGCLLAEVLTGRKLFQAGDKLATVLRPSQLLEMKLGHTETVWAEHGLADVLQMLKDLIICCIEEEPSERITADEAINHPVFQDKLSLTPDTDLSPLSTAALRFSPAEEDQLADTEILRSIREECQTYGEISDCKLAGGHALVYFQEVGGAIFARQCLLNKVTSEGSESESEEDEITTNYTKTDSQRIVQIERNKFYVKFYLYTS